MAIVLDDAKGGLQASGVDTGGQLQNVFGTDRLGPVMNPNGTVVTPGESYADWSAGVTHAADEAGAGAGGFVKNFLEPAGEVLGTVGAMGAAVAAAPIAGAIGGVGGAVAGGAIAGAAGSGLGEMASGHNLSATGIGEGALLGGVGGGLTYGLGPQGLGLNPSLSQGISKAATGAIGGGISGGGVGALEGAVGGGVSGAVGGTSVPGAGYAGAELGGLAAGEVGNAFSAGINSPGGQIAGNSGMMNTALQSGDYSSLFGGAAGLASSGLAMNAASGQNNLQQNAYTTAGNAANSGNTWGTSGIGGMGAQFANGQLGISAGGYNPMVSGYQNYGSNQLGMASAFGSGGVPGQVSGGYNNYMAQLGLAQSGAAQGQQAGAGMMNAGSAMFNSAGTNYNSAYTTSLNAGLSALNPAIQQQSNALLNSNFERGQAGTSGGALQTQALQNSFNTADEQVQQNAVSQGLAAMNTTGQLGLGAYTQGSNQMGQYGTQMGSLGSQGMNAGMSLGMYSPQLGAAYLSNANQSVAGGTGINNMGLANASAGLSAQTNVGNQMNKGASTQGSIADSSNYNSGAGSVLAGLLGNPALSGEGGAAGGISSMLSGLFGGSNNPFTLGGSNSSASAISQSDLDSVYSSNYNPMQSMNNPSSYFNFST